MKILGIDYGTKRIGLAISDDEEVFAFPKEIIFNDLNTFKRLSKIIKTENISDIVVGESIDFSGKPNFISIKIEAFILELKNKFGLPIYKQKEFLTSAEARRYINFKRLNSLQTHNKVKQIKSERVDASAAALILQRYLDKNKH